MNKIRKVHWDIVFLLMMLASYSAGGMLAQGHAIGWVPYVVTAVSYFCVSAKFGDVALPYPKSKRYTVDINDGKDSFEFDTKEEALAFTEKYLK